MYYKTGTFLVLYFYYNLVTVIVVRIGATPAESWMNQDKSLVVLLIVNEQRQKRLGFQNTFAKTRKGRSINVNGVHNPNNVRIGFDPLP